MHYPLDLDLDRAIQASALNDCAIVYRMNFNKTRWSPEEGAHDTTLINMGEGPRGQGHSHILVYKHVPQRHIVHSWPDHYSGNLLLEPY